MAIYFGITSEEKYPNQNSLQMATILAALINYYAMYRVTIENELDQNKKLRLINEAHQAWDIIFNLAQYCDLKPADVQAMVLREERQWRTVISGKK